MTQFYRDTIQTVETTTCYPLAALAPVRHARVSSLMKLNAFKLKPLTTAYMQHRALDYDQVDALCDQSLSVNEFYIWSHLCV